MFGICTDIGLVKGNTTKGVGIYSWSIVKSLEDGIAILTGNKANITKPIAKTKRFG